MSDECLKYNPEYRIAICTICNYAVPPHFIKCHFTTHHMDIFKRRQAEIELFIKQREPHLAEVENVLCPDGVPAPIKFLRKPEPGFCCRIEGCDFITNTERSFKTHCSKEHEEQERRWETIQVQTFFNQPYRKYFRVKEPPSTDLPLPKPISTTLSSIPFTIKSNSLDAVLTQLFSMLFQKSVELHRYFNEVAPEPLASVLKNVIEKKLVWEQVSQEELSQMRDTVLDKLGISELDKWTGTGMWIPKLFPRQLTEFEYRTCWSCRRCSKKFDSEPKKIQSLLYSLFGNGASAASMVQHWLKRGIPIKCPVCKRDDRVSFVLTQIIKPPKVLHIRLVSGWEIPWKFDNSLEFGGGLYQYLGSIMRKPRDNLPSDYDFSDNPTKSSYSVVRYKECFFRFGFGLDEKEGIPVEVSEYDLAEIEPEAKIEKVSHFYWKV